MNKTQCPCVLPSPTEEEVATLPGTRPGTAFRVRVEPNMDGYVRLEQLAYSADLGWYTQKSFCLPGEVLRAILPHLRKADCLIPRRAVSEQERTLRLAPPEDHPPLRLAQRRDA